MTNDIWAVPAETTKFDRVAAAWVRKHYPGSNPVVGSVNFHMDAAAYASAAWAEFKVTWKDEHREPSWPTPGLSEQIRTIDDSAWEFDASELMRELLEMEDPG